MTIIEILNDIDFQCSSTSATYSTTNKIRNVNIAYNDVARLIWETANGWQYDDSNISTLPISTTTLVHNQQDYSLPTTAQRVERVEVKDNGGTAHKLKQVDIYDVTQAMTQFQSQSGLPQYYDLVGRSLVLYPTPSSASVTLLSGLKVYVARDVTPFAVSATTTLPGFATSFHRILTYAASLDFIQNDDLRKFLIVQKARLESGLTRFYAKRNVEYKLTIKPAGKKLWRQYL